MSNETQKTGGETQKTQTQTQANESVVIPDIKGFQELSKLGTLLAEGREQEADALMKNVLKDRMLVINKQVAEGDVTLIDASEGASENANANTNTPANENAAPKTTLRKLQEFVTQVPGYRNMSLLEREQLMYRIAKDKGILDRINEEQTAIRNSKKLNESNTRKPSEIIDSYTDLIQGFEELSESKKSQVRMAIANQQGLTEALADEIRASNSTVTNARDTVRTENGQSPIKEFEGDPNDYANGQNQPPVGGAEEGNPEGNPEAEAGTEEPGVGAEDVASDMGPEIEGGQGEGVSGDASTEQLVDNTAEMVEELKKLTGIFQDIANQPDEGAPTDAPVEDPMSPEAGVEEVPGEEVPDEAGQQSPVNGEANGEIQFTTEDVKKYVNGLTLEESRHLDAVKTKRPNTKPSSVKSPVPPDGHAGMGPTSTNVKPFKMPKGDEKGAKAKDVPQLTKANTENKPLMPVNKPKASKPPSSKRSTPAMPSNRGKGKGKGKK